MTITLKQVDIFMTTYVNTMVITNQNSYNKYTKIDRKKHTQKIERNISLKKIFKLQGKKLKNEEKKREVIQKQQENK